MTKTLLSTALIALVTPLIAIAAPIHASARTDAGVAPQRVVDASDLDLGTADGRATFDRRLKVAVKEVCNNDDTADLASQAASRACRAHVRDTLLAPRNAVIVAAANARARGLLAKN